ncbi:glucosaminidase domain-containing protein [Facklamia sp. P12950]|uniref:glucosaminidase domain-containing protein n=2 Tax=unclassified Facklamia TaxID=2622293 RepID=UPI003D17DC0C
MNRKDFIEQIAGLVEKYSSPVFNSVRIAQACLESNFGQSDLAIHGKNLFGIKASYPWAGELYTKITKEEVTGKLIKVPGDFRKYASWELSVKDHASFFTSTDYRKNVAYKDVLSAKTPEQQARALTGTYATDSTYGAKLINLINEYDLKQYDKEDKKMLTFQQCADILGLKIKKQLAPVKPRVNCFGRMNDNKYGITTHNTGNVDPRATAQMHANLQSRVYGASWHWQVDDKEAIQSFEDDVSCWHASDGKGPGNMRTIAFEGCINRGGNYKKAMDNMAKLSAIYCYLKNWDPLLMIKQHYDYAPNKKNCPAQIRAGKEGITWGIYLSMIVNHINTLRGTSRYNPKGLETFEVKGYTSPKLPFKELKVGDMVTIENGGKWYDPQKEVEMKPSIDVTGKQAKIKQVKDIKDVSHSKVAYLLEDFNSWILEEHIKEAKSDWVKVEDTEINKDDRVEAEIDKNVDKEFYEVKDGQFYLDGVLYEIKKA